MIPRNIALMTRAAQMLRALIEAHALMCQCQRERTSNGAVIATFEDYAAVRPLLEPYFGTVKTGIPPIARQVVTAIEEILVSEKTDTVTYAQLEKHTGVHAEAWRQRFSRIAKRGAWVVNTEERLGFTAKLKLDEPLPDEKPGLPTVDDLRRACDTGSDREGVTAKSALQSQTEAGSDRVTRVTRHSRVVEVPNATDLNTASERSHVQGGLEGDTQCERCPQCDRRYVVLGNGELHCRECGATQQRAA
jgi:hypothetical protein